MDETPESPLRIPLMVVLLAIVGGGTLDLVLDKPDRWLSPHVIYELTMIAAALVAKQPDRYGLRVDTLAPFAFDSVLAPGGTPLAAIAAAARTDVPTIADLNPSVLRGMLPVGDSLWVRVPAGTGTAFVERYAALDSAVTTAWRIVTSKKGESMASIAKKHGLTAKKLGWYNPSVARLKSGNLVPGQAIRVPSLAVADAAMDVPNPAIERYPRRSRRPVTRADAGAAKAPATARVMTVLFILLLLVLIVARTKWGRIEYRNRVKPHTRVCLRTENYPPRLG